MTYRQQKGLTLQAGWEDELDFGLDLYRDTFEASLRILTPIHSPEVLTPVDLDALEVKDTDLDFPTDVCKLSHIEHERPVLFHKLISGSSVSSSSVENNNETLESPVVGEGSDLDSMPELEDETNLDSVKIPLWLIPNGVMVTFMVTGTALAGCFDQDVRRTKLNIRRQLSQLNEFKVKTVARII